MVNKTQLIGRVGQDPEIKITAGGTKIAKLSLATTEKWTKNGEKKELTQWHRLTFFDKLADIVEQYVHKGDLLYCEGKIKYSQAEKNDVKITYTEIQIQQMQMLGSKKNNTEHSETTEEAAPVDETTPEVQQDEIPF